MKQISILFVSAVFFFTACSKKNNSTSNPTPTTGYSIDSSYYFKISFNGQTLHYYGLNMSDGITSVLIAYPGCIISTQNGSSQFSISNTGNLYNSILQHTNVLPVITTFTKSGNSTGLYLADSFVFSAQITDLNTSKIYSMDTTTTANVTSVSVNNVIGTFSGNLIDGTSVIPATGSFCLKKLQ